jgi:hypothetical protein
MQNPPGKDKGWQKVEKIAEKHYARSDVYAQLMEEAKIRMTCIGLAAEGYLPSLPGQVVHEFCYLQLRMLCEVVALAILTAHGDMALPGKLRKAYSPDEIFERLGQLHPDFFPVPIARISLGRPKAIDRLRLDSDATVLTKDELIALHAKCGDVLHRGSLKKLLSPKMPTRTNFPDVNNWLTQFIFLLDYHFIHHRDGVTSFLCELKSAKHGDRVRVGVAVDMDKGRLLHEDE